MQGSATHSIGRSLPALPPRQPISWGMERCSLPVNAAAESLGDVAVIAALDEKRCFTWEAALRREILRGRCRRRTWRCSPALRTGHSPRRAGNDGLGDGADDED